MSKQNRAGPKRRCREPAPPPGSSAGPLTSPSSSTRLSWAACRMCECEGEQAGQQGGRQGEQGGTGTRREGSGHCSQGSSAPAGRPAICNDRLGGGDAANGRGVGSRSTKPSNITASSSGKVAAARLRVAEGQRDGQVEELAPAQQPPPPPRQRSHADLAAAAPHAQAVQAGRQGGAAGQAAEHLLAAVDVNSQHASHAPVCRRCCRRGVQAGRQAGGAQRCQRRRHRRYRMRSATRAGAAAGAGAHPALRAVPAVHALLLAQPRCLRLLLLLLSLHRRLRIRCLGRAWRSHRLPCIRRIAGQPLLQRRLVSGGRPPRCWVPREAQPHLARCLGLRNGAAQGR